jgi:hypothetical protein
MLSFLKEQNSGQSQNQTDAETQENSGSSAAGTQEPELLTVSNRGRDLRKSTITLIILFAAGLLCLWFMIKKSSPKAAVAANPNTEQTEIESKIIKLTGIKSEMSSKMNEIVKKFYEFSDVLQVEVHELVKNPFQLEDYLARLKVQPDETGNIEPDADLMRRDQLNQKAKTMQLISIMQTDLGMCCMINNKILYKGNLINDFEISEIGNNYVKLRSEDIEVTLRLKE